MTWVQFLNENSGAIQSLTTVILAIITGIYAYFTYRMVKIMKSQVIAEIEVDNIILGSPFVEDYLKNDPERRYSQGWFRFRLLFDVRNRSSGNGSIDKPILILKFASDGFEDEVLPDTKEYETKSVSSNMSQTIVTDLGGTIFLRGGESKKVELEYNIHETREGLRKHLKNNLDQLEFFIKFRDNRGRSYILKAEKIVGEREAYRK